MARRRKSKHRRRPGLQRVLPGASPGQLEADPAASNTTIRAITFGPERFSETDVVSPTDLKALRRPGQILWVQVAGLGDIELIKRIGTFFELHALALEDVVNQSSRPKLEEYTHHAVLFAQSLVPDRGAITQQVAIFWGEGFVVTFQETHTGYWERVRERLRGGRTRIRTSGSDYLAYALADATIDHFYPAVEERLDALDELEEDVLVSRASDVPARINLLKRDLVLLRRAILPLREALTDLHRSESGHVDPETPPYVRDALDHVLQLAELVDAAREQATHLLNLHMSLLGLRTNEIMRVLTIIATIFIPLTFVAGVYGMNFANNKSPLNMPELQWYYGYPASLVLMAAIAGGLIYFFRRKGWLGSGR